MRRVIFGIVTLCLLLSFATPHVSSAQYETEPGDAREAETSNDLPALGPALPPLLSPLPGGSLPDPGVVLDGRVRVLVRRNHEYHWVFRIENGSAERIGSFSLAVPNPGYDSRITPAGPVGWTVQRERGEGELEGQWVYTWAAVDPSGALRAGGRMEVALASCALLLGGERKARLFAGIAVPSPVGFEGEQPPSGTITRSSTRLVLPWDSSYRPIKAPLVNAQRRAGGSSVEVPFPVLSFLPVPPKEMSFLQGVDAQRLDIRTTGRGVHAGHVFHMTVRSGAPTVAVLERGTVLVPSLPQYDAFIVGRSERLIMASCDTATIAVRGYSITYGRKAPPPRLVLHDLEYRFAPHASQREIETYRKIVARSSRFVPLLGTPLGDRYFDTVVQWAIWRAQRLMESNPLSVRDVERDMSQVYAVRQTLKGPVRDYILQPLQVSLLARRVWSDTDALLQDASPDPVP